MAFQQNAFQHNALQTGVAAGTTPVQLDGGDEFGWLGLQSVIGGVVLAAAALVSGNAQSQTFQHQDEVPYVTGNPIGYGQPYTQRAQVKPVFIQMASGDDIVPQAAPSPALDESLFDPTIVRNEVSLPGIWPDETISRILIEESPWTSQWVIPQISVAPVWGDQEDLPITPAGSIVEESEYLGPSVIPRPALEVWNAQDEITTAPTPFTPMEEDWNFSRIQLDDVDGTIWVTDDDIASAFAVEEIGWKAEWLIPKPFTEVYQTQDDRLIPVDVSQGGGGSVYDEISIFRFYQEDDLPIPFVPLQIEEDKWLPHESTSRQPSAEGFIWVEDDEHLPLPIENERWPLVQPAYLGKPFVDVFSRQDEVFSAVRDEEPWLLPSYPAGPFTGTFVQNDETVPQPPILIEVEETYWLQPDPPRGVVTSWQFSLEINEDFPELSTPPVVDTPRVHGFEIGPEHGRKGDRTRRGLVTIVEDEAKPERKTITKRDIDHRRFEQARERALEIIADAAQQHAKATKPESQRFASVRMSLKPLAKPLGGWNWISVYQRLYQAALLDAIKNELAIQDGIDEEGAIIAMLMEML